MTELHFDRGRSAIMLVLALGMLALFVWGILNVESFGRSRGIGRMLADLSPGTLGILFGAGALGTVWAGAIYLRQMVSGRPAARIEDGGVRLRTAAGERFLDWQQIERIEQLSIGRHRMIRVHYRKPSGGRTHTGLVASTLAESRDEIALWVEEAQARLAG